MKNSMKFLPYFGLIIFLCGAPFFANKALAQDRFNIKETFTSPPIYNECTGETIVFNGVFNVTFNFVTDGNGSWHYIFHANLQNTSGVGDKGGEYRAVGLGDRQFVHNCHCGKGSTETIVIRQSLISKGSDSNAFLRGFVHVTVNANGEVVSATFEPESITCSN